MTIVCKEWFMLSIFYQPLCNNKLQPRAENDSCPICVVPVEEPPESGSGE